MGESTPSSRLSASFEDRLLQRAREARDAAKRVASPQRDRLLREAQECETRAATVSRWVASRELKPPE
jgi:hypothetical protein